MARVFGSYHLTHRLGGGGMGEVWRARHAVLGREAAVKLIRPEMLGARDDAGRTLLRRRFEREANATASLTSPHTVDLYDFGVADDGTLWYAMALLEGWDLDAIVRQFGPMPPGRVAHLLVQVCDALSESHAAGLVHRDIKPANLHVGRKGIVADFVQVLDFGLVKLGDSAEGEISTLTADGVITGSPAFLPPELAGEGEIGPATDLYALGCVAFWLLSGQLVFPATNGLKMILAHLAEAPRPLAQVAPEVPDDLATVVMHCLVKASDGRPANAAALKADLMACACWGSWSEADAQAWWREHAAVRGPRHTSTAIVVDDDPTVQDGVTLAETPEPAAVASGLRPVPAMLSIARADVVARLRDNYTHSVFDLAEFERRVEAAEAAKDHNALAPLVADLPALPGQPAPVLAVQEGALPPGFVPQQRLFSIFSGVTRQGPWRLSQDMNCVATMGGIELDLTQAQFPPGPVVLHCKALMGGIEITVPPDLEVEVDGFGFLGAFVDQRRQVLPPLPGRPKVIVTGLALMGAVEVRTPRKPGFFKRLFEDE